MSEWGLAQGKADLMVPGDTGYNGERCTAGQFGVDADSAIIYSNTLAGLRSWLRSALDQLPPDRDGRDLVTVDEDWQGQWISTETPLYNADDEPDESWEPNVYTMHDLMEVVAEHPGDAGWHLAYDVERLWVTFDDVSGDLMVGVTLAGSGLDIGIGVPLTDDDFSIEKLVGGGSTTDVQLAHAALLLVAERINNSY